MNRRSFNLPQTILALAAAFTSAATASPQVSARQGTPEGAAGQANLTFVSPMVLEAPLPVVPGEDTIVTDFSRYSWHVHAPSAPPEIDSQHARSNKPVDATLAAESTAPLWGSG